MMFASSVNNEQQRFHTAVIFGDSLSDTGNVFELTNGTWPLIPPYYQGRFTNDTNWVDRLKFTNISNYAYGGATTDNSVVQGYTKSNTVPVPGVRQQIEKYINSTKENIIDFEQTLYIISAGGNDFIFSKVPNPIAVCESLSNSAKDLIDFGAKHILFFNQSPVQGFPYIRELGLGLIFKNFTNLFNNLLALRLKMVRTKYPHVNLKVFDFYSIIKQIISEKSGQFSNTVDACWDIPTDSSTVTNYPDPSNHVFIDKFHFTSNVHQIIADSVCDFISNAYP